MCTLRAGIAAAVASVVAAALCASAVAIGSAARPASRQVDLSEQQGFCCDDDSDRADWPMFRGNALLSGVATSKLPEKLALLWTFQAEGKNESIESSPAVAHGVVYIGTIGGYLHAIDLGTGKGKWKYYTGPS